MVPIKFADIGKECIIKRICGKPEVKKHLENLGFTVGGSAMVISTLGGNIIVKIKESRVAIDSDLANKILI